MKKTFPLVAAAASLAAAQALAHEEAFGHAGEAARAGRTVEITMSDAMRYEPSQVRVKRGETVRFVITNAGKVEHEFVLGTMKELRQHADLMRRFPDMHHEEAHMASVKPGGKAELVWDFTKPGTFYYGCLIPGHFESGMVGKVLVAKGRAAG